MFGLYLSSTHRDAPICMAVIMSVSIWTWWCWWRNSGIITMVISVIRAWGRRRIWLGVVSSPVAPVILLILLTLTDGWQQVGRTYGGIVFLVHYHRLIFRFKPIEKGFLRLTLQIASTEHVGVKLLQFHPYLEDSLIVVLGRLGIPLLDAVQFVQERGVGGSATVDLIQGTHNALQ